MFERARAHVSLPSRQALTLYGGLFLAVMAASGMAVSVTDAFLGNGFDANLESWLFIGLLFGYVPAFAAVLFLKIHRYAYPPDG